MRRSRDLSEQPEIEVVDLDLLDLGGPATAVRLQTSGARVDDWWRQVRHQYAIVVAANRGITARRHSRVELRVDAPVDAVVEHLRSLPLVAVSGGSLRIRDGGARYDEVEHTYVLPARLDVAWSWPALPVWLTAGAYTTSSSLLGLQLRSHTRLRYPTRYFHVAHRVLALARDGVGQHTP